MTELSLSDSDITTLFNLSAEIFCIINPQGNFEKLNPVWQNLLGWTPEELQNQPWMFFIHPDDVAATLNSLQQSKPDTPSQFENRFQHKDGLYLWVSWKALCHENGTIFATGTDITPIKRLHRQFSSQRKINTFFSSPSFGVAVVDKQLRFLQINQTLADIHGIQAAEHLGKTYRQTLPHLASSIDPLLHKVFRGSKKNAVSQFITTTDKPENKRHWQLTIFPIEEPAEPINTAGILVTEITEIKQREQILHRRLALFEAVSQISKLLDNPNFSPSYILQILGENIGASRGYIFEFTNLGTKINNQYQWCAQDISPLRAEQQNLTSIDFSWWVDQLVAGESINISDISTLPENPGTAAQILREQNIRSRLWVPIKSPTGQLTGLIGFDALHTPENLLNESSNTWLQNQDILAIQTVSEMLSRANHCKQITTQLNRISRTLKAKNACKKVAQNATNSRELLQQTCRILVEVGEYSNACLCEPAAENGNITKHFSAYNFLQPLPISMGDDGLSNPKRQFDYSAINPITNTDGDQYSVSLPLVAGEFNFGTLNIDANDPNAFQEEEINALHQLATEIAQAAARTTTQLSHTHSNEQLKTQNLELEEIQNPSVSSANYQLSVANLLESKQVVSIPHAIFSTSLDGTYLDFLFAENFEPLIPSHQLIGKKISEVFPAPLGEKIIEILQQVCRTGLDQTFEYKLLVNNQLRSYVVRSLRYFRNEVLSLVQEVPLNFDDHSDLKCSNRPILSDYKEWQNIAISNLREVVIIVDKFGNFLYIFPEDKNFLGYSTTEIYGLRNIQRLWGDNLYDPTLLTALGEANNLEISVKDKSGKSRQVLVNINRQIPDSENFVYTCWEVSELEFLKGGFDSISSSIKSKYLQNLTEENSQNFEKIFEEGFQGIALMRRDGRFLKVNSQFSQMLGYTPSELTNLTNLQITYSEDIETDLTLSRLLFAGELPSYTMQKRYLNKNQELVWTIVKLSVVCDGDNKPLYGLAMIENITERKNLETELLELKQKFENRLQEHWQKLEAGNKQQENFCYAVAQNLQAPLRSINGFCAALLEDNVLQVDLTGQHYLQRIRYATERMGKLIEDLLSLSRIKYHTLQRVPVNLSYLAKNISLSLEQTYPTRSFNFQIVENVVTYGDSQLLYLLLEILLKNAIKYSAGLPEANIEFGEKIIDGERVYFVCDNGIGFDMAYADKLFTFFGRLHPEKQFEGSGMGLAIAWHIVERHGGRIWVEAAPKKGSTFYFTLN